MVSIRHFSIGLQLSAVLTSLNVSPTELNEISKSISVVRHVPLMIGIFALLMYWLLPTWVEIT